MPLQRLVLEFGHQDARADFVLLRVFHRSHILPKMVHSRFPLSVDSGHLSFGSEVLASPASEGSLRIPDKNRKGRNRLAVVHQQAERSGDC